MVIVNYSSEFVVEKKKSGSICPVVTDFTGWLAGNRYPSGMEIWCAMSGSDSGWTMDRTLAAVFDSKPTAAFAACLLAEGDVEPFWFEQTIT